MILTFFFLLILFNFGVLIAMPEEPFPAHIVASVFAVILSVAVYSDTVQGTYVIHCVNDVCTRVDK